MTGPVRPDSTDHRQKITTLMDAGIRPIINLMEESEHDHKGRLFVNYEQIATRLAGTGKIALDIPFPTFRFLSHSSRPRFWTTSIAPFRRIPYTCTAEVAEGGPAW
ncbi:MAG: hypothetical protein ACYC4U_14460 [Pirellulaceae bacterium]